MCKGRRRRKRWGRRREGRGADKTWLLLVLCWWRCNLKEDNEAAMYLRLSTRGLCVTLKVPYEGEHGL